MTTPSGYQQYDPSAGYSTPSSPVTSSMATSYYDRQPQSGGTGIMVLIFVGIILAMVGKIIIAVMFKVDDSDAVENLMMISTIMTGIGGGLAAMGLIWGGLGNANFGDNLRLGLIIAGGIAIGLYIGSGMGLWSLLGLF